VTGPAVTGPAVTGPAVTLSAGPEPLSAGPAPGPAFEGAGVLSSWADLGTALGADDLDPAAVTFTAAAAGLDTLGAALHPFDALLRAGLGWLIEHIEFLREPLDALAGDPAEVLSQARSWHDVAEELRATATDYRQATVPGWDGAAADSYRHAVDELVGALGEASGQALALSRLILVTGAGVGTVRALIRDAITDFLATVLQYLLAAGTLAFLTAGGSLATLVLTVVVRALEVAQDICRRVRLLLDTLAAAGGTAGRIGEALRHTATRIRAAEPGLRVAGEAVARGATEAHAPVIVEAGKQITGAAQERDGG
jgi:hypothetical protein